MANVKQLHDEQGRFQTPYPEDGPLLRKSLGLRLPSRDYEKAVALAEQRKISLSKLLREATQAGLKQIEQQHRNFSEIEDS